MACVSCCSDRQKQLQKSCRDFGPRAESGRLWIQRNWQGLHTTQDQPTPPAQLIGGGCELQSGRSLQQHVDRDLSFQTGQRCAEAEVNAQSEGKVLVWVAGEVEPVRIGKLSLVAIG